MKQAKMPLYSRLGEIPDGGISYVHLGDYKARPEGGLSVWKAVEANGRYYPVLPEDANEAAIADYFDMLLADRGPVYLLTGSRIRLEGADREPLLQSWVVIKEITHLFGKNREKEYEKKYYPNRFDTDGNRKPSEEWGDEPKEKPKIMNDRGDIYD